MESKGSQLKHAQSLRSMRTLDLLAPMRPPLGCSDTNVRREDAKESNISTCNINGSLLNSCYSHRFHCAALGLWGSGR